MRFKAIVWDVDDTLYYEKNGVFFLYDGIKDLLKKIPIENNGIISNGQGEVQKRRLREFDILKYFNEDLFFCSWDEAKKLPGEIDDNLWYVQKPREYMFRRFLEKVECSPEECLMIGDSDVDVLGAKRVGMEVVYVDGIWKNGGTSSIYYDDGSLRYGVTDLLKINKGNIRALEEIIFS